MPIPESGDGMDFYSSNQKGESGYDALLFPELEDHEVENFFAFSCIQNHGFWYSTRGRYERPITGIVAGREYRGSALLCALLKREFDRDHSIFEPYHLAHMSSAAIQQLFVDDRGLVPLPDIEKRVTLARHYGASFRSAPRYRNSPKKLIGIANHSVQPLRAFYFLFSLIPGFREDPFQKKIGLFAMEMISRPEHFLVPATGEDVRPIVDYHIMRVSLRSGMVILARALRSANAARVFVSEAVERAIRTATYHAVELLAAAVRARLPQLTRVMSFVDHALWQARDYCPELTTPDCPSCAFKTACRQDIELFQPVFRTLFY